MSEPNDVPFTPPSSLDRDRYVVEKVLGTGGTATVLLARDTRMNVDRAIKVLHPRFSRSRNTRARFMNEAQAQAQLKHPNVLMVHDVIDDDQGVYMVMELAEQGALGTRILEEGCFTAREVADIGIQVGEALTVAHAAGMVHRDIKPANILVDRHGVLKLADFGIARVKNTDLTLTRSGSVMGTWAFMPPEQREDSASVDHRSDIYAFGVTLYALLTGRGTSRLHNREAWNEAYAGVPPGIAQIIQRATRLYPEDRYPQMADMVQELKAWRASTEGSGPGWSDTNSPTSRSPSVLSPPFEGGAKTAVPSDTMSEPEPTVANYTIPATHDTTPPEPAPTVPLPPPAEPFPWLMLGGVAAGGMVVAALVGIIVVLMADRFKSPSPPLPDPVEVVETVPSPPPSPPTEPAEPTAPPDTTPEPTPPAAGPKSPPTQPADNAKSSAPESSSSGQTPKRRIIKVIDTKSDDAPSQAGSSAAPPDETGKLLVRTIPSGASVLIGGRTPPRSGGAFVLPIGTHTVVLVSGSGERHSVPVTIRTGKTVDICYSFDTNSACGATP